MTTPSFQPPLGRPRAQSRRLDYPSPEPVAGLERSISRADPDPPRQPRTIDDHREQYHWRDLAPQILRQRLVVEGTCDQPIGALQIRQYLNRLATVCAMRTLTRPVTHRSRALRMGRMDPLGNLRRALLRVGPTRAVLLGRHLYLQSVRSRSSHRLHRPVLRHPQHRRPNLLATGPPSELLPRGTNPRPRTCDVSRPRSPPTHGSEPTRTAARANAARSDLTQPSGSEHSHLTAVTGSGQSARGATQPGVLFSSRCPLRSPNGPTARRQCSDDARPAMLPTACTCHRGHVPETSPGTETSWTSTAIGPGPRFARSARRRRRTRCLPAPARPVRDSHRDGDRVAARHRHRRSRRG